MQQGLQNGPPINSKIDKTIKISGRFPQRFLYRISAFLTSILGPCLLRKSIPGTFGREQVDLRFLITVHAFSICLDLGGCPGSPKMALGKASKTRYGFSSSFLSKMVPKRNPNETILGPGRCQNPT